MPYTKNPHVPKVRGQAVELVRRGWSTRRVARHFGFRQSAIVKWCAKAEIRGLGSIPTLSSRPKKHPRSLARELVTAIIRERQGRGRCAEHVHYALKKKGVVVSLSSVKRTLDRCHLLNKRSPWKRPHDATPRPVVTEAGALVQVDTVHFVLPDGSRLYVYTLIDLYSRWAWAEVVERIGAAASVRFLRRAERAAPFRFQLIQTDHGSEFSSWFTHGLRTMGSAHRHSRVRQPNDNAHVERFNRTLQEECLDRTVHTVRAFKKALRPYLEWYNTERSHLGINYQTPSQLIPRC
jgi:transposase InsO family protein